MGVGRGAKRLCRGLVGKGVAERSLIKSLALTVDTVAFML